MQNNVLHETKEHGDVSFPFAYYYIDKKHPRYTMNTHWHEECEICRILEGELKLTIDDKNYVGYGDGGSGDIFFFNPGSLHTARPIDCTYECIVFDLHFLLRERSLSNAFIYSLLYNQRKFEQFLPLSQKAIKQEHTDSHTHSVNQEIGSSVNQLFDILREKSSGYKLRTFGIMYYLLGLFEQHDRYITSDETNPNVPRIMKMRMVLSYIHRNYKHQISLNDLSDLLELRPPSVVKLFKDIVNKKPMEYINSYRIQCAMELLKDESSTVTNVAYETGFNDVSYFTKVFKKYAQMSPRDYLKDVQKQIALSN